ncbi:cytochrome d oxidase cyd, subunit II [secondary endosymbiont of Heteropsylla cubana]|uniref:Cytochrome d oxidase cyd, subunit II n=1 Tax=secondary endosymbiont of Heteropsylla cubana TaxID=134287 RepID=J3TG79_9ENTR|nr:cytochrome d ubiquinol oxidase subunit II [secondary endosymbiont of Heteropsylla cubana]AFP85367.1 cytochrome d oxidase cyd, subunit II [secondary endosymbiont of Heteropsylla cubana]
MFSYELLRVFWWVVIGLLLIGFAITNGFDMGVGILMRLFGRNDIERRIMINTIAPHWDGNQVWLIATGGALFAAWPIVYATAFSSFYTAMILILTSLFFRPVGFDYRSKINNSYWRNLWDWGIFIGSIVSPVLIGVIFGNLLQGIPFYIDEYCHIYYNGYFFQMLNPFSLLLGVVSLSMFVTQGASYLQIRTTGNLQMRMRIITQYTSLITIVTFLLASILVIYYIEGFTITSVIDRNACSNPLKKEVTYQIGAWLSNYQSNKILWIVPALGMILPLFTITFSRSCRGVSAFVSSSLSLTFIILTAGITLFPFIIPSTTMPNGSLTIWDATSSLQTLKIMAIITIIFMPIVLFYTIWCYYKMLGRITTQYIQKNTHSLY